MLIWSMRAESTAAIAQAIECSRICSASSSRRSAGSNLESRKPRMRYAGSRITAAATTGPNSDPRPTSSTPATCCAPINQARFSNLSVQRSFFSRRSLAADAEMSPECERFLESFDAGADLEADLDTGIVSIFAEEELRCKRRRGGNQKSTCHRKRLCSYFVILSGVRTARSAVRTESKDPYSCRAAPGAPSLRFFFLQGWDVSAHCLVRSLKLTAVRLPSTGRPCP